MVGNLYKTCHENKNLRQKVLWKGLHKTFGGIKKKCANKIKVNFLSLSNIGAGGVKLIDFRGNRG